MNHVITRTLIGAALAATALFVGACGSGGDDVAQSQTPTSNAELVRVAMRSVGNPWGSMTDAKIDQVGSSVCTYLRSQGGDSDANITSLASVADTTSPSASEGLPDLNSTQTADMLTAARNVYCPDVVS